MPVKMVCLNILTGQRLSKIDNDGQARYRE